MRSFLLIALMMLGVVLPIGAQQIDVEEFKRIRKPFLRPSRVKTDKQKATIDLLTNEKGFAITANGKEPVEIQEGEGMITVKTPHKTQFLVIKHPDYGQTLWKPEKVLKRKKRYQAYLHTYSPKKQFHPGKQWVVFEISPENAILQMDSTIEKVRTGKAQYYLPLGTHKYKVESPFHQAVEDSIVLTDSVRANVQVVLQPFYSYLTVKTPSDSYEVYIDDQLVGSGVVTSGHLSPGNHQLTIKRKNISQVYCYDRMLTLGLAEKLTIELSSDSLKYLRLLSQRRQNTVAPANLTNTDLTAMDSVASQPAAQEPKTEMTEVALIAPNDSTEIWLNREHVSTGNWEGKLKQGFYMVEIRQGDMAANPSYFWVDGSFPVTVNLSTPEADYGMLSIHSNVVGADLYINNVRVGTTPTILERLPRGREYIVTLQKEGYKSKPKKVKIRGNDLTDVNITMKKIHKK